MKEKNVLTQKLVSGGAEQKLRRGASEKQKDHHMHLWVEVHNCLQPNVFHALYWGILCFSSLVCSFTLLTD